MVQTPLLSLRSAAGRLQLLWVIIMCWCTVLTTDGVTAQPQSKPPTLRIRHGDLADASDPGGNLVVAVGTRGSICTGVLANHEWIVTAGHCVGGNTGGGDDYVEVAYTTTDGTRIPLVATTVVERVTDPDFAERSLSPWYGNRAARDFGMLRLRDPVPSCDTPTDDNDNEACWMNRPNVPANAEFVYRLALAKPASVLDRLLGWFVSKETPQDDTATTQAAVAAGYFDPSTFVVFGYGITGKNDLGSIRLRTTQLNNDGTGQKRFWLRGSSGQYWVTFYRDRVLGDDDPRTCGGDSGAPLLVPSKEKESRFAVAGLNSGGTRCHWWVGVDYSYRFRETTADLIQNSVESSGGRCERINLDGDLVVRCYNRVEDE